MGPPSLTTGTGVVYGPGGGNPRHQHAEANLPGADSKTHDLNVDAAVFSNVSTIHKKWTPLKLSTVCVSAHRDGQGLCVLSTAHDREHINIAYYQTQTSVTPSTELRQYGN